MNAQVAEQLQKVLSDTFVLYYKTHAYHWNVEGIHFKALHELFEEQYNEMWEAIDDLAERLRAIKEYAPISLKALMQNASLQETGQTPDAKTMVENLVEGHEALVKTLYEGIKVAEEAGDEVTTDMFVGRATQHEKTAWMLHSLQK